MLCTIVFGKLANYFFFLFKTVIHIIIMHPLQKRSLYVIDFRFCYTRNPDSCCDNQSKYVFKRVRFCRSCSPLCCSYSCFFKSKQILPSLKLAVLVPNTAKPCIFSSGTMITNSSVKVYTIEKHLIQCCNFQDRKSVV